MTEVVTVGFWHGFRSGTAGARLRDTSSLGLNRLGGYYKTGLSVVVNVSDKIYETGRKVAKGFKEKMKIIFDEYLPKWNYRAVPTI
ncbi:MULTISPECIES: ISAzo13-like element transposase-related protein [unclassified Microcoleus]|uniref:ISAzo13-like element transposase-related protein n=1 Tax=unclassified Microcoleus TaxID=2642155 RepID=UPI002FD42014